MTSIFKSTSSYRARPETTNILLSCSAFKSTSSYRARPINKLCTSFTSKFKSTSSYRARLLSINTKKAFYIYLNPLAHIELDANINDGDLLIFEFKSTSSYRARQQKCIEFKLM